MNYLQRKWRISPACVLPRGQKGEFDSDVAGDPCIVWDEALGTWRMFYFCLGQGGGRSAIALSRSAEQVGPGDWRKEGLVPLANPEDLTYQRSWHKWWVVLDPHHFNRAARIDGRYWSLFASYEPDKVVRAAHAETLSGPWHVIARPILIPGEGAAADGLHCDAPTAYWFAERNEVIIFYMAYPRQAQSAQPTAPFGSASVWATWWPGQDTTAKKSAILRPGRDESWASGWIGGVQILPDQAGGWYALINASPTPPEDNSNREPAPSLGGWAFCQGDCSTGTWEIDTARSPFKYLQDLSSEEKAAGLGVNFWRHHLLVTPGGKARIFFNSGRYGHEQMYCLV